MNLNPTEVADFLKQNPDFLIQNPGILAFVHLPSQVAGNVASLQERQVQTLRDKTKALEQKLVGMSRAAVENQAIWESFQTVQRHLLTVKNASRLPEVLFGDLKRLFTIPMINLQLWGDLDDFAPQFLASMPEQDRQAVDGMSNLYCGFAEQAPFMSPFEAEDVKPRSVVLMPLRVGVAPKAFGLLSFGSPDKDRFAPTLERDFLNMLSETVCASLTRLSKTAN